nr:G protein-coupled receptor [Proales similis]
MNASSANSAFLVDKCQLADNGSRTQWLIEFTNHILVIYPWVMVLFGTVTNTISFYVLTRPKLKKSSTFFYLACLSIIDMLTLFTFCFNFILYYQFNVDIQLVHVSICKLFSFLIYFLPQLSAWTCTVVSLDRVVGVIFTVRGRTAALAKKINTPQKARQIMIGLFMFIFSLNVHFFLYPNEYEANETSVVQDINVLYCSAENIDRFAFIYNLWVYIDLSMNVLIPFAIMLLSSAVIIYKLVQTTKNVRKRSRASNGQRQSVLTNADSSNTSHLLVAKSRADRKKSSVPNVSLKARNVSAMLVANNLVFISLTLPVVLFLLIAPPINQRGLCDYERARLRLLKVVCIILMNSNCTVNIFIYSLMASEFRKQLLITLNLAAPCVASSSNTDTDSRGATASKNIIRRQSSFAFAYRSADARNTSSL